ncbi:type II CRISPR RNA-guided endonuclease Cas9, partial [Bacteroidales bacterium OttesenSCG-928-I21]|nr:type II CRISPR RNA-guided endonuclease Cas9 [Bacteroidales bacterium OttesenSCG-928-I21]
MTLSQRDFVHLFLEDIIFYQRPLRSQKSTIGTCSLEYKIYKQKDENGNFIKNENGKDIKIKQYLQVIPKSHPLYQEFRVWQWMSNLKFSSKEDGTDVTMQFVKNDDDKVALFEFLMQQKEVNHKDILKYLLTPILKEQYPSAKSAALNKEIEKEIGKYRWNYVFDDSKTKEEEKSKKYPCNTTGYEIRRRLEKVENISADFLTSEIEQKLWHIIYSVTDKNEFEKALKTFAEKYHLEVNSFVENFKKFPPFKSEYGAYSEKAIKKLLPLMRLGKYWKWDTIDVGTQNRIFKIITGEYDEAIKNRVREKAINLTDENHFQGLPLWLASYVVYDRHSEADIAGKWTSVADLEEYLENFRQHSLRNPIVEQIVTETLRVVRNIWKKYGEGAKDFFNEIHVELGREMKNTAEDRQRMTQQVSENENTNLRIKALLMELKENSDGKLFVEDVRPYSPIQQDALKIFEEYALQNNEKYDEKINAFVHDPIDDEILKISKTAQPSKAELQRYKLWLEQRYRSPYTGQMIPLGKLFTEEYQIEHIIPKSRYFDDSFNNKVICEAAVNQLKDKLLGFEFIKAHYGEEVELGKGKKVKIFTEDEYKDFVSEHYAKNYSKRRNLLLDEIPDQMIARQMNDTRYISKFISQLLSNIVRAEKEDDGINSKNLIPVTGKITTALKQDWGMNDVWNDLILPRFQRINELTNSQDFTVWNANYQKYLPTVPLDLSKNFQKKRIDHRHHAMDALVIACATRDHVNLLNNQSAKSDVTRYDLQNKLRDKEKVSWIDKKTNEKIERDIFKEFKKPWKSFTADAKNELEKIVVSFKQNLRVINKSVNYIQSYKDENGMLQTDKNGKPIKVKRKQVKGDNWAIRKPLHKEFVFAKVELPFAKVPKGKIAVAIRRNLDSSFDLKRIESITDTGIQKILKNYLAKKENNPALAFSSEGIEDMNNNIAQYNDGKFHKPIYKVRTFEIGSRFALGESGNKKDKYVEAADGTNLYYAVYEYEEEDKKMGIIIKKRSYETIALNIVIERLKQGLSVVPKTNEKGHELSFF